MIRDAASGLLAVAGGAAVINAGDPGVVAGVVFFVAIAVSCLRPQFFFVCPVLGAGAVAAREILGMGYAADGSGTLFSILILAALASGIGLAGAGVGRMLSALDRA